ncbi:MAG TPA: hypothetical protein VFC37_19725 [Terracidiphilus sp.]|nr:hypothetical protein [Terracidiphilus sp.]
MMPNTSTTEKESKPPKRKGFDAASDAKPEKIRAELNIEKWPAIWNPTHSKIHSKENVRPRTLARESTGLDGTKTLSQVTINPISHLGDLTTEDQRTLYALIKHWEERGKPSQETPFSIRHVAKLLHKTGWGTNVIDSVTGSLERLRGTLLVWTRSYRSKDQRVEDLETVYINILSKLKIVRRKVDGHVTTEAGYFQFDDHILKNLLSNYTKPFLFDVFIDIKGEIALKLYSYLDLIMADKSRFERCTRELFEDLGLKGSSYRNPSKRKQNLQNAFAELTGIMLTTGVLKSATIEKTKDGKDFKAVFQKVPRSAIVEDTEPATRFAATEAVIINDYSKQRNPLTVQAQELVRHFHKVFHGVGAHVPQSKETDQALALITQYGLEKSRSIIDFARDQAAATNYRIQHFGAVLSYTSRALAEVERQDHQAPAKPVRPSVVQPPRPQYSRGESRIVALSKEQYDLRFETIKTGMFLENQFLANHQNHAGSILSQMVRARMIRDLDQESMELMPVDWMPEWLLRSLGQNLPL